ncbi:hypothetical protein EBI_25535 [Enterocytozoon bieneusi H348]|nr:hypothetical protein EBI_25535 [Enterocytozoon bieneusi H348]|eukprot:XP_002650805.1 hypothetical protein EBI_25535 [Enterocytozoon bieneusi H348]
MGWGGELHSTPFLIFKSVLRQGKITPGGFFQQREMLG